MLGITGGVGAGKSRVLALLEEEFGARIILADEVARQLQEPGQPGFVRLRDYFGDGILDKGGRLDRAGLAARIFEDPAALAAVNGMIHPLVWETIREMVADAGAPLAAIESALFDRRTRSLCQEVWFIDTSDENRISRLMAGRGYTREKCISIIRNQKSREEFLAFCDVVIDNNGSLEAVRRQVRREVRRLTGTE